MTKTQNDQLAENIAAFQAGSALQPLFTWHGMDVYPVWGAEGDDAGEGNPDSEPDPKDDNDTGTSDNKAGSDTVTREDFDKLKNQLIAADKNKSAAEKKLKEIEDSKKDELTKATERAEELEKTVEAQGKELADMRLQNAFLTANTDVTWYDNGDALVLAKSKGYLADVVGEDGAVDATLLGKKLKEMASKHPHLVKSGSDDSGEKEKPPASGTKVGTKPKKTSDEPNIDRYARHFNR